MGNVDYLCRAVIVPELLFYGMVPLSRPCKRFAEGHCVRVHETQTERAKCHEKTTLDHHPFVKVTVDG